MKRSFWVLALAVCTTCATARADMIDTKSEGAMDGTVVSEDAAKVVFKDSHGQLHTYARADVMLLEKTAASASGGSNGVMQAFQQGFRAGTKMISAVPDLLSGKKTASTSRSRVTSTAGTELSSGHYEINRSMKVDFDPTKDLRSMVLWAWVGIGALGVLYYMGIRLVIAAFQTSIGWGVLYLFVPGSQLVFWACHWDKAGYFVIRGLLFTGAMALAYLFLLF